MSMDSSAIREIQKSEATENANHAVAVAIAEGKAPVVALPETMTIRNLEEYLPGRTRYRGSMKSSVIADFTKYVKDQQQEKGSVCFIDPDNMAAKVFFNLGTIASPGHGDFTATLKLDKGSEYTALLNIDGCHMSQKELAEWFEDWAEFLTFFDGEGNPIDIRTAISAIRRLTIESHSRREHEDKAFSASRSALESIEAKSDHGLPHGFRFTCIPFKGLSEHSFECRISILAGGDAPKFVARIKQLDLAKEKISENFMSVLEDHFVKSDVDIYRGNFSA